MRFIKYWLPTILWASLIFYLSSRHSIRTTDVYWQDFTIKKTAHFAEYFILTILLYRSLRNTTKLSTLRLILTTLVLVVLYASSDEFHQNFVLGREPRIRDVVIDSLGGSTALLLTRVLKLEF